MKGKINQKYIIGGLVGIIIICVLIKIIGVITENPDAAELKRKMKDAGFSLENASTSDYPSLEGMEDKFYQAVFGSRYDDEALMIEFKEESGAFTYVNALYLEYKLLGYKPKVLKKSNDLVISESVKINEDEEDKIVINANGYFFIVSRRGKIALAVTCYGTEAESLAIAAELGY